MKACSISMLWQAKNNDSMGCDMQEAQMEELVNVAERLQQLQEQLEAKEAQADKLIASSKVIWVLHSIR